LRYFWDEYVVARASMRKNVMEYNPNLEKRKIIDKKKGLENVYFVFSLDVGF
jgi:hypothetical protein